MKLCLTGALYGDTCGAPYEFHPERDPAKIDLAHSGRYLTDDSILTLAVAKAILEKRPYRDTIFELALKYPDCGFGGRFYRHWIAERNPIPYNSFGNGAAMRVSPVGWAFETVPDVLREAEDSAACSHNAPEGIASAQAVALAIFLARKGQDKEEIASALEERFDYDLSPSLDEWRAISIEQGFDETWRAIPPAIGIFLTTESLEDCVRQAIALGCDADTQAAIAASIAEAYYGPSESTYAQIKPLMDPTQATIFNAFSQKYGL